MSAKLTFETVGEGPPVVIGHSMGGKTAIALVLEHPQAIAGVRVIDIAPQTYTDQFSPHVAAMRGLDMATTSNLREIQQTLAMQGDGDAPVDFLLHNLRCHGERFDWRLNLIATALCMRDLFGFPPHLMGQCFDGAALFAAPRPCYPCSHRRRCLCQWPLSIFIVIHCKGVIQ